MVTTGGAMSTMPRIDLMIIGWRAIVLITLVVMASVMASDSVPFPILVMISTGCFADKIVPSAIFFVKTLAIVSLVSVISRPSFDYWMIVLICILPIPIRRMISRSIIPVTFGTSPTSCCTTSIPVTFVSQSRGFRPRGRYGADVIIVGLRGTILNRM